MREGEGSFSCERRSDRRRRRKSQTTVVVAVRWVMVDVVGEVELRTVGRNGWF